MKKVVIYGAGGNAKKAYKECVELGYDVVAFCDSDPQKIGVNICGLKVESQIEIKQKYKDSFFVLISPEYPLYLEIYDQIIRDNFVTEERILKVGKRNYISCDSLEKVAVINNEGIFACCNLENIRNAAPYVSWNNTISETVKDFVKQRDLYIKGLQYDDKNNPCIGCPALHMADWDLDRRIKVVALSLSYPCQLACSYCELETNAKHIKESREVIEQAEKIDISELMECLKDSGKLKLSEPIQLSGGEITVAPKKKELLNAVSDYPLQVFTNAIIYDGEIASIVASNDKSYLNVSIDAGTAETYKKVKGKDEFENVVSTLMKYHERGARILLKYIILPDNASVDDYDGFLDVAEKIDAINVYISCDITVAVNDITSSIIDGAIYMAKGCIERHINYTIMPYFGDKNVKYILDEVKSFCETMRI